jgi:hypothetical protein
MSAQPSSPRRQFELVTQWRLEAPTAAVWERIEDVAAWPRWWPSVRRVETLAPGDADGIGAIRRLSWQTALPYDLTFDVEVVRVDPHRLIEGRAFGELEGTGAWTFAEAEGVTTATYDWRVDVGKPWMRRFAPLLRPVFAWNHGVVMRRGEAGLTRLLAAGEP